MVEILPECGFTSIRVGDDGEEAAARDLFLDGGGGVKPGISSGETDPIGYESMKDKVSVHALHATMLHLLGFDHEKLSYPFQGVNQPLTNITKSGTKVVKGVFA